MTLFPHRPGVICTMPTSPHGDEAAFPDRLRIERERLALSQTEFGRLGGVSKTAQWQYERGKHWPTMEYIEGLRANRVDVTYLVTGSRMTDRLDWEVLREAFLFVQRSYVSRSDRRYSDEQLYKAFKLVVEAAMGLTRPDLQELPDQVQGETELPEGQEHERRG